MNTADESLPPFSIHPHSSAGQMNGRIHTFAVVISGPIWCTVTFLLTTITQRLLFH
jgi:hypothetical protein